jgi:hypothetical protein
MISDIRLAEILQDILNENKEHDLIYNSYFRISKIHSESLKTYKSVFYPKSKVFSILKFPIKIIRTKKNLLIFFTGGILFSQQYRKFKVSASNCSVLFISHATNNNLSGNNDTYFGNLPTLTGSTNNSILYLNHLTSKYNSNYKKLIQKKNCTNVLLMPKFLRPGEFFEYVKHSLDLRRKHLAVIKGYGLGESQKKEIMIEALNWIFTRESYNNFLLAKRLSEILKLMLVDKAFLTLEGHSYEEILSSKLKKINPNISLFLYQHSPITPAHSGIQYFLENFRFNLTILTTGKKYTEYISRFSNKNEVVCIGSIKKFKSRSPKNVKISTILIAPEGTKQSAVRMMKLMAHLCKINKQYHFVLRLHPNLKVGLQIRILLFNLAKLKNAEISKQNLESDLYRTQATFYVGSTVAIQALNFGNLPVFINIDKNKNLNVMSILKDKFPVFEVQGNGSITLDKLNDLKIQDFNFGVSEELFSTFNPPIELIDKLQS